MSKIILDFGSGNTCRNDKTIIKKMYDELKAVDTGKHDIICKWQLFEKAGDNIPLTHDCFDYAYKYGTELGYKVTSSVFDKESLDFLLQFDVPFIKIANNRKLDWLIGEIPRKFPIYISLGNDPDEPFNEKDIESLLCVSEYPATMEMYRKKFRSIDHLVKFEGYGISDHTTNFGLWYRYEPKIIEMHYKLNDSTGLDSGSFARTPAQLSEIL